MTFTLPPFDMAEARRIANYIRPDWPRTYLAGAHALMEELKGKVSEDERRELAEYQEAMVKFSVFKDRWNDG